MKRPWVLEITNLKRLARFRTAGNGGGVSDSPHELGIARVPTAQLSSCEFDSEGTLWVTLARADPTNEELAGRPLAGSAFGGNTDTYRVPVEPVAV